MFKKYTIWLQQMDPTDISFWLSSQIVHTKCQLLLQFLKFTYVSVAGIILQHPQGEKLQIF